METTSPVKSLNFQDVLSLLKNVAIFFIPMIITILGAIQSGTNITWSFVIGLVVSSAIKMLEYYYRNNLPTNPQV